MTTANKTTTKGRPRKSQQHQNNNKGKTPNQRTKTKEDPGNDKSKQNNNKGKTPEMTKANKPTKTTRRQHTNIQQLKISSIPCLSLKIIHTVMKYKNNKTSETIDQLK
jgi:hypothetical protein